MISSVEVRAYKFPFKKFILNFNYYEVLTIIYSKMAACGLHLVVINLACIKTRFKNHSKHFMPKTDIKIHYFTDV